MRLRARAAGRPGSARRTAGCALLALALAMALGACANAPSEAVYPEQRPGGKVVQRPTEERKSVFGPGGLDLFGSKKPEESGGTGLGVNSFLWRASLDTLSFMPLVSADPFGGVIITDWYSPPEAGDERFKAQVYILGRQLRSDGIKVAVFRQVRNLDGWREAEISSQTATEMEDAILTRARQLRIDSVGQ